MNRLIEERRMDEEKNGAIIRARGVRKTYDTGKVRVEALRGVDVDVYPGEMVAVMRSTTG
jgi:putative ABC transport system ATP-binding protein